MIKKLLLSISTLLLLNAIAITSFAQENPPIHGMLWITVSDNSFIPDSLGHTTNQSFNSYLQTRNFQHYKQVMPWAPTERLRNVYELQCDYNEAILDSEIRAQFGYAISYMEYRYLPIPLYDPADYMWYLTLQTPTDWLWSILKIQGNLAWDITKGDPNLKVAIVDWGADITHPDLVGKIDPPYDFYTGGAMINSAHGTSVATLLAAETVDQGQTPNGQMASIGYNTKVMFADCSLGPYGTAMCLYASTVLGARIISISWFNTCSTNHPWSATDLLIEQQINDNGSTIFRAAGNGPSYCGGLRLYPFSGYEDPRTIVVTSSDKDDHHENLNPGGQTNSHYPEVDICAPGYCLMAGVDVASNPTWPYYGCWGGTSQSTPVAAGVGALILSVNSCLTSTSVQDIIKSTADPIVDAANYPGQIGAGRINAYQSVLAAQAMYSSTLDLFMKDIPHDFGVEPDPDNGPMWISDDIWVRNQQDGLTNQTNQNPEYNSNPAIDDYVYVRIRNKSCVPSLGTEQLKLYWAKAATALSWPANWNGTTISCTNSAGQPTTPQVGNQIGTGVTIPIIQAGSETILQIPWHVPNPDDYFGCNPEPWHFCLLARIEATNDPMTFAETASVYDNAKNDNTTALLKLYSLANQNQQEDNMKQTLTLNMQGFSSNPTPAATAILTLDEIAHQHPFYGGVAVYYARAMLRKNVEDVLPQMRKAYQQNQPALSNQIKSAIKLNPNPANGYVTILSAQPFADKCILVIENTLGNKVAQYNIAANSISYSFNTFYLINGIYTCKIISGNEIIGTQRLVIIK